MKRVFITGATGCVGHYLVERMLARDDRELCLLVRDPARFRWPLPLDRVTVLTGDVRHLDGCKDILKTMDAVVHVATAWGGASAYEVNVDATLALARLAPQAAFIPISSASVLDEHHQPLQAADELGTDYIRSKLLAYRQLKALTERERVTMIFPTIIFASDPKHPISHASSGLPRLVGQLWLARQFTFDGSFHFIHARDLAIMIDHLVDHPAPGADWVIGNALTTVDEAMSQLCSVYGLPRGRAIDLTPLAPWIARLAGRRMSSWDRYCLAHRHFRYQTLNPRSLDLPPGLETFAQVVSDETAAHGYHLPQPGGPPCALDASRTPYTQRP